MHLLLNRHLLVILVALHEVGNAGGAARISQHLLARLRILTHHLLLLLLLELVVQGLELAVVGATCRATEHGIDVLSEGNFRAEAVHLVVVRASLHANRVHAAISIVEVRRLLYHAHAALILRTIALTN